LGGVCARLARQRCNGDSREPDYDDEEDSWLDRRAPENRYAMMLADGGVLFPDIVSQVVNHQMAKAINTVPAMTQRAVLTTSR
jgi:hypothetical protein